MFAMPLSVGKHRAVFSAFIASVALLLLSTSVFAVYTSYSGNVSISANSSTNGALVGGYIGSTLHKTVLAGRDNIASGKYVLDFSCTAGSQLFIKIWGINATHAICGEASSSGNVSADLSVSLVPLNGACTYTSACSGANVCCSGTTAVNDGTTSGATCKATCAAATTATDTSSGGSSSSGGGGGGTALGSESSTAVTITGSSTTSLSFTKSETLAVTSVELSTTSTASITNGKIVVKETTVGESMSSGIVIGSTKIYKYLSITKQNIKDSDLSKAKISFEVPVSWLNANGIDADTVTLSRYVSNQWVALPTTKVKAVNSKSYLYEAETPGFSVFAISGKASEKLTAFQLIDVIRDFYSGKSAYTAFEVIDKIRAFYA